MSDYDDDHFDQNLDSEALPPEAGTQEPIDDEMEDDVPAPKKVSIRNVEDDEDDEEDEDEEDEDDEEEDEDEDDNAPGRKSRKRTKRRHKRSGVSVFLDTEAQVSEDEDEEEEEEGFGGDDFIETVDEVDDDSTRRHHAILDSKRQHYGETDKSPEQIAKDLSMRYKTRAVRYTGDMNAMPQRLLMPSVHDASLWQVRVKVGREREIVFSLMRKSMDVEFTAHPLSILAAFQRDSLPGIIYVEARSAKMVQEACNGLVGVYPSRGISLVPIEEMASLLQIKKQDTTVTPGTWVRIKRGKYAGDLAQVMDITENGEDVGLKFIPRIDLNPRDDAALDGSKKRKKAVVGAGTMRPPQRLFNYEEVVKVYGRKHVTKRNQTYVFQNDSYKDGFIEKDFKLNALSLDDVNPTLDEITQFTRRQDGGEVDNLVDLSIIAEASRKAAISVLQPGDHVEVFEGEQAGVHGVVDEIAQDVVTITAVGVDLDGQKVEVPARSVRKRFKPGDHVKVMTGQNADETGLVVSVADNIVTFLSDMSMQEVSVFSKDLREAAEVGSGTNIVGNYELHDLVQLDAQTVGVIFKTERDSFRVLDQNGQIRLVQPHQISMRRDSTRAIATDSEGHELRINDNVKEIDGESRKGRVLHIHQSFFAFLHNRDIVENGGVFVTRARSLASLAPKSNVLKTATTDLSKMNPALVPPSGGMVGSGNMGRGPRDRHIGATVVVVKGPYKGYAGTIKDTNGPVARVELRTGNKVISIDKDKLFRRLPDGKLEALDQPYSGGGRGGGNMRGPTGPRTSNPYANSNQSGARTPFNVIGRTPNPYASGDGRTPGWNPSRTPNAYTESGKTPAWNASSQTPNPYAGGQTPGWNVSRTPNPYAAAASGSGGWGGASPAKPSWGGATPGRNASSWGSSAGEGWASPPRAGWGDGGAAWSAPTPAAAATPGLSMAQTPAFSAQTPGATARTPAGVWSSGGLSAPTPGAAPYYPEPDSSSLTMDSNLPDNWLSEPKLANYRHRLKLKVHGTRADRYLDGDYEGKTGRLSTSSSFGDEFDQSGLVIFDSGEERTIVLRYLVPIEPTHMGEEVLICGGSSAGRVVVVREKPDDSKVTVSTRAEPVDVSEVPKNLLIPLYEEAT